MARDGAIEAIGRASQWNESISESSTTSSAPPATGPLQQLFEERLRLVEAYEQAGIWGYHVAQHHATPLGMAPSPNLFLAAAAQRTRNLRLGTLVYLLPFYSPLRLIEEICMLDHMTGGRLEIGVGRGVSPSSTRNIAFPFTTRARSTRTRWR